MAALDLVDVEKRYGSTSVIERMSLSIAQGEFVVLVGPSGCGKSTLLRMIAGLEPITRGDLLIDGKRANDVPPQRRNIAMVFQSYALFPHMTVRENIGFGPKVRREPAEEAGRRIEEASRILGLGPYLDRRPSQLSGGQRQRVAMGRAIVRNPRVFLFDEPLSNLDAQLRIQMRTEIKALHQKLLNTIVYVTHDQIEAMTMADRIVVMNAGRIEQAGTPLALYDRPASLFVAGFIGAPPMSFLRAMGEGGAVRLVDGTELQAGEPVPSGPLTVGIRPEAYRRDPEGPVHLRVVVVEPTGPEVHVVGEVAGAEVRAVFRDRTMPAVGEVVRLAIAPGDLHLFDPTTGRRLGVA
jgi:multiple sugar transport system ATP-binding protein